MPGPGDPRALLPHDVHALREAGYDETIYLHGAMVRLVELYEALGQKLGPWDVVTPQLAPTLAGKIVL